MWLLDWGSLCAPIPHLLLQSTQMQRCLRRSVLTALTGIYMRSYSFHGLRTFLLAQNIIISVVWQPFPGVCAVPPNPLYNLWLVELVTAKRRWGSWRKMNFVVCIYSTVAQAQETLGSVIWLRNSRAFLRDRFIATGCSQHQGCGEKEWTTNTCLWLRITCRLTSQRGVQSLA